MVHGERSMKRSGNAARGPMASIMAGSPTSRPSLAAGQGGRFPPAGAGLLRA